MDVIKLRDFKHGDEIGLFEVFLSSIHLVCSADYDQQQLAAWAPDDLDPKIWNRKIRSINPFIALKRNKIVGYSDVQENGLVDHFYVHGQFQRLGVGRLLMTEVIKRGTGKDSLYSEVSHTAKPFFKKYGFEVIKEQTVSMRNVTLTNNLMVRKMHLSG